MTDRGRPPRLGKAREQRQIMARQASEADGFGKMLRPWARKGLPLFSGTGTTGLGKAGVEPLPGHGTDGPGGTGLGGTMMARAAASPTNRRAPGTDGRGQWPSDSSERSSNGQMDEPENGCRRTSGSDDEQGGSTGKEFVSEFLVPRL